MASRREAVVAEGDEQRLSGHIEMRKPAAFLEHVWVVLWGRTGSPGRGGPLRDSSPARAEAQCHLVF